MAKLISNLALGTEENKHTTFISGIQ